MVGCGEVRRKEEGRKRRGNLNEDDLSNRRSSIRIRVKVKVA